MRVKVTKLSAIASLFAFMDGIVLNEHPRCPLTLCMKVRVTLREVTVWKFFLLFNAKYLTRTAYSEGYSMFISRTFYLHDICI